MLSCSTGARLAAFLLAALLTAFAAAPAWSQLRTLPTNAKRAMLTGHSDRVVTLSGERRRLAPGAIIFDTNNRTILPNFLPEQADVIFTTDTTGAVLRIYLLTPQEQKRLDQARR
jgi:hypothetical protein